MDNNQKNKNEFLISAAIEADNKSWEDKIKKDEIEAKRLSIEYTKPDRSGVYAFDNVYADFIGKLSEEIKKDEYKGLDEASIADILNSLVEIEDKETGTVAIWGNRISQLFMGIPYAPNIATAEDVVRAIQLQS